MSLTFSLSGYPKLPQLKVPISSTTGTCFEGFESGEINKAIPDITPKEYMILYRYFSGEIPSQKNPSKENNPKLETVYAFLEKVGLEKQSHKLEKDISLVEAFENNPIGCLNYEMLSDETLEILTKRYNTIYILGNDVVPMLMFDSDFSVFWTAFDFPKSRNYSVASILGNTEIFPLDNAVAINGCDETNYIPYCQYLNLKYRGRNNNKILTTKQNRYRNKPHVMVKKEYLERNLCNAFVEKELHEPVIYRYLREMNTASKSYVFKIDFDSRKMLGEKFFAEKNPENDKYIKRCLEVWIQNYYNKGCFIKKYWLLKVLVK